MDLFAAHTIVDGDVFCGIDTVANIVQARREVTGSYSHPEETILQTPLEDLCTSDAMKQRVTGYSKHLDKFVGTSDTVIADISQNPEMRKRLGPWVGTLAKNTLQVMFKGAQDKIGHVMTVRELALSQGWPSIPTESNRGFKDCISFDMEAQTKDMRHFLGNGMHMCATAAFLFYLFAHIIRRDVVREFLPDLRLMQLDVGIAGPLAIRNNEVRIHTPDKRLADRQVEGTAPDEEAGVASSASASAAAARLST